MAPTLTPKDEVSSLIKNNKVIVFSKSWCPYCKQVKELFNSLKIEYHNLDIDLSDKEQDLQSALLEISGQKTVPNVYINGNHVGGASDTLQAHADNKLFAMINETNQHSYDYDLVVVGGGSGGLAASKQAAELGKKVLLCDFVKPTPKGTTWGLGGTCVNVGCIPKKLMHQGSLLGKSIKEAKAFGWDVSDDATKHKWETMVQGVQDHIGSLNWGYRVECRNKKVEYLNAYAELVDAHTVKTKNRRGVEKTVTTQDVLIAVGERPRYPPHIPNIQQFSITSDDLFSLPYCPGKTLVVGASYVALECACFLKGVGLDVTVMVRSIFLRGFDQDIAEKIGSHMEEVDGVKIVRRYVPISVEKLEDGEPGKYRVTGKSTESEETYTDEYNTIIFAIGRDPCTNTIGLDNAGVLCSKSGKIPVNDNDQTNVQNIYCIGDSAEGRPELTPVAILCGNLLAKRLYAGSDLKCDFKYVPTTVFTSLEYSCCGLAEEDAEQQLGVDNLEIYHTNFTPLEWTVPGTGTNVCYCKVIVNMLDNNRVVGLHYLGPNAGEVMQGFAAALRLGLTKEQLDVTVGIHPTNAEIFTTMHITKRSGKSILRSGC